MPLYDCMLLLKPNIKKEALMELVARVGKHVYTKNGVLTDLKSFGTIQLGYGIKKLDGRYFQINPPGDDVMWIPYGFLSVKKEALMELVARVGKHVYTKNGVLTDLKSFGTIQLGYGIKKLDGRYFQKKEIFVFD
ncbi:hypothetical protein ACOSQ2_013996 [Xanthoceras sorbifolium]